MRRKLVVLGFLLAVGGGAALTALPPGTTQAASGPTFLVPANDGYGVADCVSTGSACAKVVADAWCEAQGYAHSATYGMADAADTTASIGAAGDRPISITCAN